MAEKEVDVCERAFKKHFTNKKNML